MGNDIMIGITINDKHYNIFTEWEDMTLNQATAIRKEITHAPPHLLALYNSSTEDQQAEAYKEVDSEDVMRGFPTFYGKMISLFSDIPEDVMNTVLVGDRVAKYKEFCEWMVRGVLHMPREANLIEDFVIDGVKYELPKSKNSLGIETVGGWMEAIEFTEHRDLLYFSSEMEGGVYEYAANIISIICRPKGEAYHEQTSLDRVEMFKELKMDVVHGVFFSLIDSMSMLITTSALSSLREALSQRKPLNPQTLASLAGMEAL